MNETKKLQYYSHEPHCKEEIFNLGTKLWFFKDHILLFSISYAIYKSY